MKFLKKGLFAATAMATAIASAPAFAGGGHSYGYGAYGGGYYAAGYGHRAHYGKRYYKHRGYSHRRYKRHHRRHHRHGRGGDAALIALGVIGGAIILNEATKDDRRYAYEDRRYRDDVRHRRYDPRRDDYYYQRGREQAPYDEDYEDEFEEDAPRSAPSRSVERDDLDDQLLGGDEESRNQVRGEERLTFSVQAAYQECSHEARNAASRDGQFVAMPAQPTNVEVLDRDLVRITADLTAQDQRGRQFLRTLTCEADPDRITFLRLS